MLDCSIDVINGGDEDEFAEYSIEPTVYGVIDMGIPRLDYVGVVVEDLDAVAALFLALGFEREAGHWSRARL